jgi:hypothetical protein
MVNLVGLMPVISAWDGKKTDQDRNENRLPLHAGNGEHYQSASSPEGFLAGACSDRRLNPPQTPTG